MNAQTNVEIVEKAYADFARGDAAAILAALTEDVTWTMEGPEILPYAGTSVGPASVAKFFEALATTQSEHKLTMTEFVSEGDRVASFGRYAAVVNATGKRFDSAVAHVFTIRDGKISRFQDYGDTAAMAAAYVGTAGAAGR